MESFCTINLLLLKKKKKRKKFKRKKNPFVRIQARNDEPELRR
jgi:hypothetical protein